MARLNSKKPTTAILPPTSKFNCYLYLEAIAKETASESGNYNIKINVYFGFCCKTGHVQDLGPH